MLHRLMAGLCARRALILGYHGVGPRDPPRDPFNLRVDPQRLRRQLELVLGAGFRVVTVAELAERAAGGPPPAGLAALSFDDGMQDNHAVLLPLLREYGVPATVYVTTGLIGRPNPWLEGERMMTEEELEELAAAGFELGAHTVTHPDLSLMHRDACLREMRDSAERLRKITGREPRTFAYPFCRYGPDTMAAAREAGFLAAVTGEGRGGWGPYEMQRAIVTGRDGMAAFVLKVTDAYYPLLESLPGRLLRVLMGRTRTE